MSDIAKIAAGIVIGGVGLFLLFVILPASMDAASCASKYGVEYCRSMLAKGRYVSGR
jgi:hypothetical protein